MTVRFHQPNLSESGTATLDGTEAHHLIHVLRSKPGDVVELFDGCGLVASAEVSTIRKRDAELRIIQSRRESQKHREIVIGTAVPKGDRFDWLIEKATELGVTRLVPLVTARSVVDPRPSKLDKLRQTVIAACKQCCRNHLMEISPVTAWSDFCQADVRVRTSYVAHPIPAAGLFSESNETNQSPVGFAIGPEGGFTEDEVAMAIACGAKAVSLGPLILRIETAAIALAARATTNIFSSATTSP